MGQVVISINKREYAIACENGEEIQIIKLARILDEKATALTKALGHINETQLLAMVGLIIADELNEAKKTIQKLEANNQTGQVVSEVKANNESMVKDIEKIDVELAGALNSLSEAIKSIVFNLK